MSILSSIYNIRKINNGLKWSTIFVFTGIPLLNLYDNFATKNTCIMEDYLNYRKKKAKFKKIVIIILVFTGFFSGFYKSYPKLLNNL